MRVEELHEDSESESSVDEDLVDPTHITQMGLLNSPPPDEARNVVDAVQLLVKQMSILTSEWADMKKDLETIKAWQENLQDCADKMEVDEPEFDLPESIYDDSNDENSDEGYDSGPDEESDSEMSDSFPVHPSMHCEPIPQPSLKQWKVDERVEFSLSGIRKWVPGRIAHVRSLDTYDVWLDTGEMERCVFARELRSVQPGSIDNYHRHKNDQLTEDVFSSVDLSSLNYYDLFDSNLLKTNTKKLSEVEQQALQRRFDRAIADNPSLSLVNRVHSLPPSHPFQHASSLKAKDEIVFDEAEPDVPTHKPTLNDWKKFVISMAAAEKKINKSLPTTLHASPNSPNDNNSNQTCVEVSAQLPLPESAMNLSPRDYLNFSTDANSDPILAYRDYTRNFPMTLFDLVSSEDASIVGWQQHGTSFAIRDMDRFVELILPKYFQHNNLASFQRQLKLHGFRRSASYDKGAYFQPQFQRGQRELAESIRRVCEETCDTVWSNDGNGNGNGNGNGSGAGISNVDTSVHGMTYLRNLHAGSPESLSGVTATSVYAPTITTHADLAHHDQRTYPSISKSRTALDRNLTTTEELFALFFTGIPKNATTYSSAEIDWKVGDCVQCYEPETSIWQQGRVTNVNSYGTAASKIYSYDVQLDNGEQRRFVPACFLRSSEVGTLYYESSEDSLANRSEADSDGADWNNTHSNGAFNSADSSEDDSASIYTDSTISYRKRSQQPLLPSSGHVAHPSLYSPFKENFNVGDKVSLQLRNSHTWALGTITYRYPGDQPCSFQYDVQLDNGDKLIEVWSWQLYSAPSTREYRDIPLHAFEPFATTATTDTDVVTGTHSTTSAAAAKATAATTISDDSGIYSQFLEDDGFAPSFDSWPPEWTETWKVDDPVEILDFSTHTWHLGRIARLPVDAGQFHVRLDTGKLELYVHPDRLRVLGTYSYVNNTVPEKPNFSAPIATDTSASTITAVSGDKKHFYIIVVFLCVIVLLVCLNLCLLILVVYNALPPRTIKILM